MLQPGADTRVRPGRRRGGQAQFGYLVTHNESISVADYFTLHEGDAPTYRPTCHYAKTPCNDAVLSLHEMFGNRGNQQSRFIFSTSTRSLTASRAGGVRSTATARTPMVRFALSNEERGLGRAPNPERTRPSGHPRSMAAGSGVGNPQAGWVEERDETDTGGCPDPRPFSGPVIGTYTDLDAADSPYRASSGGYPDHETSWHVPQTFSCAEGADDG